MLRLTVRFLTFGSMVRGIQCKEQKLLILFKVFLTLPTAAKNGGVLILQEGLWDEPLVVL